MTTTIQEARRAARAAVDPKLRRQARAWLMRIVGAIGPDGGLDLAELALTVVQALEFDATGEQTPGSLALTVSCTVDALCAAIQSRRGDAERAFTRIIVADGKVSACEYAFHAMLVLRLSELQTEGLRLVIRIGEPTAAEGGEQ